LSHSEENKRTDDSIKVLGDGAMQAILGCDPSILSVFVLAKEGGVSAVARSSLLPDEAQADQQTLHQLGSVATVILSAAAKAEKIFGETEFILGAFKDGKILLLRVKEQGLAVRLSPTANAELIYGKISKILALA